MFGIYRLILALMVMAFHLLNVPIIGEYAVFSFFVLSGFLMTTIMHDAYGYSFAGIGRYAVNRFLRLYPTYWVVLVLSLALILFIGEQYAHQYKESIFYPKTLTQIIENATLIYPALLGRGKMPDKSKSRFR